MPLKVITGLINFTSKTKRIKGFDRIEKSDKMSLMKYETLQRKARKALKASEGLTPDKWPAIVHEWLDHPVTKEYVKATESNLYQG